MPLILTIGYLMEGFLSLFRTILSLWPQQISAEWFGSPQGMAAVGAGLGLLGTAGAFMVGGPLAAVSTLGTLPFQTTELIQSFGTAAWKTKGELQLTGEYSQDHVSAYNQQYSTANSIVQNIGMAKSLNNPQANFDNIKRGCDALDDLAKSLADNLVTLRPPTSILKSSGNSRVVLNDGLATNSALFDFFSNYIAKDNPPIGIQIVNSKPEWKITYGELKGSETVNLSLVS